MRVDTEITHLLSHLFVHFMFGVVRNADESPDAFQMIFVPNPSLCVACNPVCLSVQASSTHANTVPLAASSTFCHTQCLPPSVLSFLVASSQLLTRSLHTVPTRYATPSTCLIVFPFNIFDKCEYSFEKTLTTALFLAGLCLYAIVLPDIHPNACRTLCSVGQSLTHTLDSVRLRAHLDQAQLAQAQFRLRHPF